MPRFDNPPINVGYVANMVAHLSNACQHKNVRWLGLPVEARQNALDALRHLDELHKEMTGDYAPRPKAEDVFEDVFED